MSVKWASKFIILSAEGIFRSATLATSILSFFIVSCEGGLTIRRSPNLNNKATRELRETTPSTLAFSEGTITRQSSLTATWSLENAANIVSTEVRLYRDAACSTLFLTKPLTAGARTTAFTASSEGQYSFSVANKLKDGRSATSACSAPIRIDFTPPTTPSGMALKAPASSPSSLASAIITVSGVSPGDTVAIYTDPTCASPSLLASGKASGSSIDLLTDFTSDGAYLLHSNATDSAGNASSCSTASLTYTLDRVAPGAPSTISLKTPAVSPGNASPALFTVTGVASGDTVGLYSSPTCSNSNLIGSGMATGSSIDLPANFTVDGAYSVYSRATDAAGNTSPCSTSAANYLLDRVPPAVPSGVALKDPTSAFGTTPTVTFTISGTNPGDAIALYTSMDCAPGSILASGATSSSSIDLSVTFPIDGSYSAYSRAIDPAGNASACSEVYSTYTLDRVAPNAPNGITLKAPAASPGNNPSVTFTVSGVSVGDVVALYSSAGCDSPSYLGSASATGSSIHLPVSFTVDGSHGVYARSTDRAGNVSNCSTATANYTLDRVAPNAPSALALKTPASSPSNNASPVLTVSGVVAGDTVRLFSNTSCSTQLGSAVASTPTVDVTAALSTDGAYTLYSNTTDPAGNASACSTAILNYTLNRMAPSAPSGITLKTPATSPNSATAITFTVSGTASGNTIALYSDPACVTPSLLTSGFASGSSIDLTINLSTDGTQSVYALASDGAGNASSCSSATTNYTLDRAAPTAPAVTITNGSPTNSQTLNLSYGATPEAGTNYCLRENNTSSTGCSFAALPLPSTFGAATANGAVALTLFLRDAAGNISTASTSGSITIDTTAPGAPSAIALNTPSTSPGNNASPVLTVSGVASGDTVRLFPDSSCSTQLGSAVASASTVDVTATLPSDGAYSLYSNSTDPVGNTSTCSTATASYTLDRVAPSAPSGIALKIPATSPNTATSVTYTVSGVTSGDAIALYSASNCASPSFITSSAASGTTLDLSTTYSVDGTYAVYALASDAAGNTSSCSTASVSYTLDRIAPTAPSSLSWAEGTTTSSMSLTAQWTRSTSNDVASQSIQVFGAASCGGTALSSNSLTSTESSFAFTAPGSGSYSFRVSATDTAGNSAGSTCSTTLTVSSAYNVNITKTNVTANPSASEVSVNSGNTLSITLTPDATYALSSAVSGTCPAGSWSGNIYTTGAITADCSLGFAGALGATMVATFYAHTCAVVNGGAMCWGENWNGQVGDGTTSSRTSPTQVTGLTSGVTAVGAGYQHSCAIVNGGAQCWGHGEWGQLGGGSTPSYSPTPVAVSGLTSGVTAIALGNEHTCAIVNSGVQCWGNGEMGQLGNGTSGYSNSSSIPVQVSGLTSGVTAIAAGPTHTCAVRDGRVWCWGSNLSGQIGDGTNTDRTTPVQASGLTSGVTAIAAGLGHTCAIQDGGVKCWGDNEWNQLGNDTGTPSSTPVGVTGITSGTTAISAGTNGTCAIVDGSIQCWGSTETNYLIGTSGVTSLAVGNGHVCAITNGATQCSGWLNSSGQLGDGTTTERYAPVQVLGLTSALTSIAGGYTHACTVVNGGARCWGVGTNGQLGASTAASSSSWVQVFGLGSGSGVTAIAPGSIHTCAIVNGGARCWGSNSTGTLGNGTTTSSTIPVQVTGLTSGVMAISSGANFTCALVNGAVNCWGENNSGQIGDGTTTNRTSPVAVSGLSSGVTAISSGQGHNCAIQNGAAWCWGENTYGQLGNGTTTHSSLPVQVSGLTSGVTAITAGYEHTCALVNGAVNCWGRNTSGQLGNNTLISSSTPVAVTNLTSGASTISLGMLHTCALVSGGVRCWGQGNSGRLGDGFQVTRRTPVQVSGLSSGVTHLALSSATTFAIQDAKVMVWGSNTSSALFGNNSTAVNSPLPIFTNPMQ